MDSNIGENLSGKGKFYPVFIMGDGNAYSVRMSEEDLEVFQLLVQSLLGCNVLLDPEPINNNCTYRILDKTKEKQKN